MPAFVGLAVRRPWLVIIGWLAVLVLANLGGRTAHPPAPSTSFLPAEVESQRAAVLEAARFGGAWGAFTRPHGQWVGLSGGGSFGPLLVRSRQGRPP